ncbi:hypothetical protein NMY22_g11311 [Coprinellus aureogranulatus]|nr:hypothetical protein NMY22_g11311 [Coprinellus aureogranulatus]
MPRIRVALIKGWPKPSTGDFGSDCSNSPTRASHSVFHHFVAFSLSVTSTWLILMALNPALLEGLHTNYVPLPYEADLLRSLIDVEKREVATIEGEMEDLHQRIAFLDSRKATHMQKINEFQALLSPVRALPTDILGEIFLACLNVYLEEDPAARMGKHPAGILSQVCKLWRELALGMPKIWSVIDVWLPKHPLRILRKRYRIPFDCLPEKEQCVWNQRYEDWDRTVRALGEMAQRYSTLSGSEALTVAFSAKDAPQLLPLTGMLGGIESVVDAIMSFLHRVENLTLKLGFEYHLSSLNPFLRCDPQSLQKLRSARLDIKLRDNLGGDDSNDDLFDLRGPLLTNLELKSRWFYVQKMQSGIDWAALTELSLCALGRSDIVTPPIEEAMGILRRCPQLVQCELELEHDNPHTLPDLVQPEFHPINLPHLRRLTIHGYGVHFTMANTLHLPSLEDLAIIDLGRDPYNGEHGRLPDGLVPWADRYGPQLKHVEFEYAHLPGDSKFLHVLERLEGVVSLKLNGVVDYKLVGLDHGASIETMVRWTYPTRLTNAALRNLIPVRPTTKTTQTMCPRLRRLECTTGDLDFNELGFVELVASRRRGTEGEGCDISELEEVILTFNSPKTLDFEDELRKRGVDVDAFGLKVVYANSE